MKLRSFAATILPAAVLAVGDNSGKDGDNAMTVVLHDDSDFNITLNTYNSFDQVSEFHGDFEMTIKTRQMSNQEFGWCYKLTGSESTRWDCMRVQANVEPKKSADDELYKKSFTIVDGHTEDGPDTFDLTDFTPDALFGATDADMNWAPSKNKSYKNCVEDNNPFPVDYGSAYVTCEKLNAHWFREF